jgi:hypothetical protein
LAGSSDKLRQIWLVVVGQVRKFVWFFVVTLGRLVIFYAVSYEKRRFFYELAIISSPMKCSDSKLRKSV